MSAGTRHAHPLVSVNTPSVNVTVFRIGDRNYNTVGTATSRRRVHLPTLELGRERGVTVWTGDLRRLYAEPVHRTSFPVDNALGDCSRASMYDGVGQGPRSATRRFAGDTMVHLSDVACAFSRQDGIHVFVIRWLRRGCREGRGALVAATTRFGHPKPTMRHVLFEAGRRAGGRAFASC